MDNLIIILLLIFLFPLTLSSSSTNSSLYIKDTSGKALTVTVPEVLSYTITNNGVITKSSKIITKREIINDPNRSVVNKGNISITTTINKDNSKTTSTYNKNTKVENIEIINKNGSKKKVYKKK